MDCLVVPVLILKRRCSGTGRYMERYKSSRLGYHPLLSEQEEFSPENPSESHHHEDDDLISVVVGKEKREFLVDPIVLQASPFRVLIQTLSSEQGNKAAAEKLTTASPPTDQVDGSKMRTRTVIFVDVDVILFEHMLWLLKNDYPSFFNLNLQEIIDFYSQDN